MGAMGPSELILIADDEPDLRDLLDFNLRQAGYRTLHAGSGSEALRLALAERPDLLILDLMLPDLSGIDVCRRLRNTPATQRMPIIMLTARAAQSDRIAGLELGADDYVVKPASIREVVLRVEAVLRRRRGAEVVVVPAAPPVREPLRAGSITIDVEAHIVRVDGREVPLALLEFRLLQYLAEGRGAVRSREELLQHVWGYSSEVETRTVDTHIKRLRDKLGAAGDLIETVRGVGYRLRADGEPVDS